MDQNLSDMYDLIERAIGNAFEEERNESFTFYR